MNGLYFARTDDFACTDGLLSLVSERRRERIARLRTAPSRREGLAAEMLLLSAFFCETGQRCVPRIETNAHGKPYFPDFPHFRFNISHTSGAVALAFCEDEVGVDIERVRPAPDGVGERFFSPRELAYVRGVTTCGNDDANLRFFRVWTRKEAYAKYVGSGLGSSPVASIDTMSDELSKITNTFFAKEFVISVCAENVGLFVPRRKLLSDVVRYVADARENQASI